MSFLLLVSCSTHRNMRVQIQRAARITVPAEIKNLALLNRAVSTNQAVIEGTITGETPLRDKQLSNECLRGLTDALVTSTRFNIYRCDSSLMSADPRSLSFGNILSWNTIDSICSKNNSDGVLVLEFFDTDFSIDNPLSSARQIAANVLSNGNNQGITVHGNAKARAGFRVYYKKERKIAYEDVFIYSKKWSQTSSNVQDALGRLIKRNQALMDVSFLTGNDFALSIVPLYVWEDRILFKSKDQLMRRGERQALSKDWEGAEQTWISIFENSRKRKIRARAAHNVALALEVLGDLTGAQQWASKAYVEKGNSSTMRYCEIIDQRIREQKRLEEQLKNE
ncbi:MAG: DUF6340 family protein [Crocinitomicaceae bacterium]